ncbi:MAG: N-acetylneuraminate synthase family protein [Nanoarchaeota archaeon]|nr:N-acetylneuraminate synthase family protein [Nanoarchaeota archaeon]
MKIANILDKKEKGIYLILEIGRTYNNDIEKAKEMIRMGAEAGADAIKIQSINPEGLLIFNEKNKEYFENLKKLQRTKEEHEILKRECEKFDVDFISTPETLEMVDLLEEINICAYKISSLDLVYHKMIKKIAQKNKPIILSTGMSSHKEILETINLIKSFGNEKIILLHCVSLYPPKIDDLNLEMIENIKNFGVIAGFSDHTPDLDASLGAIARGARVIEKHFKIDNGEGNEWKGDYDVAITPEQVRRLRLFSKQILEKSSEVKMNNEKEIERRKIRGRKLILNKDLSEGEIITEDVLDCKQNLDYGGVDCIHFKKFVGKRISRNKKKDELLQESDILERVMVTGAGADSGLSVIRILKEKGYYVHACDADLDSSGLYLADSFSILPLAKNEDEFINQVKKIVIGKKIDVIFPNVDEELKVFARYEKEIPCKVVISPYHTVEICQNKLSALELLKDIIPAPHTNNLMESYPLIVRPVVSRGSRNVYKVSNEKEKDFFSEYIRTQNLVPMTQEFLPGVEYTIDALFDLDGNFVVAAPRKRIATKGGASSIGETEKNKLLITFVENISKKLKFIGPVNIQFKEDKNGVLKFLEINARCSGGLMISYENKLNIPELMLKILRGEKINDSELNYKEGKVYRYLTEVR